jgi:hypothetical protein
MRHVEARLGRPLALDRVPMTPLSITIPSVKTWYADSTYNRTSGVVICLLLTSPDDEKVLRLPFRPPATAYPLCSRTLYSRHVQHEKWMVAEIK